MEGENGGGDPYYGPERRNGMADWVRRLEQIEGEMKDVLKFATGMTEWRRHIDQWMQEQREQHKQNQQTLAVIQSENRKFSRNIFLAVLGAVLAGVVSIGVHFVSH